MKNASQFRSAIHNALSLREILSFLGRQRLIVFASVAVALLVWGAIVMFVPPTYRIYTSFTIDARTQYNNSSDPLNEVSFPDPSMDILTAVQVMQGETVLGQAYQNQGITFAIGNENNTDYDVNIDQAGYTNEIIVTIDSHDTAKSVAMANDIPRLYKESSRRQRDEALKVAIGYLETQYKQANADMQAIMAEIERWTKAHPTVGTASTDPEARSSAAAEAERSWQGSLAEVESSKDRLASLQRDYAKIPKTITNPGVISALTRVNALKDEIAQLKATREQMLVQYLPDNPLVKAIDAKIAEREKTLSTYPDSDASPVTYRNPNLDVFENKIADARGEVEAAQARLARAVQWRDSTKMALREFNQGEPERSRLSSIAQDRSKAKDAIFVRLQDLTMRQNAVREPIQVVTQPQILPQPVKPRPLLYFVIALVAGTLMGLGFGALKEHFDDRVTTPVQVVRETEAYILSVLPPLRGRDRLSIGDSRTSRRVANAVNLAKQRIETIYGLADNEDIRSLMLASMSRDEDRSFLARNLAVAYAASGRSVILVSVGPTSQLEALGGYKAPFGYSDLLAGTAKVADVIVDTDLPGVKAVTEGNAQVSITATHVAGVHQLLLEQASMIIYDGPSYLFPFDIQSVGSVVDATVIAVKPGVPKKNLLGAASDVLRGLTSKFLGVILTSTLNEEVSKDIVKFEDDDAA